MQNLADADVVHDREALIELKGLVEAVVPAAFTKLQVLTKMLRDLGFDKPDNKERIVIFSERIATLEFLEADLLEALRLSKDQVEQFHGTLKDVDQTRLVESFGNEANPVRILLASDAASEGINLHYFMPSDGASRPSLVAHHPRATQRSHRPLWTEAHSPY